MGSRKPTPLPSGGSPLWWVAGLASWLRSVSRCCIDPELKSTAGGPATRCKGFSCTLYKAKLLHRVSSSQQLQITVRFILHLSSFAPKTTVALVERPFSLPSHYDMEVPPGRSRAAGSVHRCGSCRGRWQSWGWVALAYGRCGKTQPSQEWQKVGKYGLASFPYVVQFM